MLSIRITGMREWVMQHLEVAAGWITGVIFGLHEFEILAAMAASMFHVNQVNLLEWAGFIKAGIALFGCGFMSGVGAWAAKRIMRKLFRDKTIAGDVDED